MTKRDKIIMASAIILAICVVATAILVMVSSGGFANANRESFYFVGGILAIGILSVIIVYFSKVRKSKAEQLLEMEYYHAYETVKDVVSNSQLTASDKREIKEDILDLLLSAQTDGKSVEQVVGDPLYFSYETIRAYAKPSHFFLLNVLDGVVWFSAFTVLINTALWLEEMERGFFEMQMDISMAALVFVVSFFLIPITKKMTSKNNPWGFALPLVFGIAFVLLAELARAYFYNIDAIALFLDGTLDLIPDAVALALYIVSIPVALFLKKTYRKKCYKR